MGKFFAHFALPSKQPEASLCPQDCNRKLGNDIGGRCNGERPVFVRSPLIIGAAVWAMGRGFGEVFLLFEERIGDLSWLFVGLVHFQYSCVGGNTVQRFVFVRRERFFSLADKGWRKYSFLM